LIKVIFSKSCLTATRSQGAVEQQQSWFYIEQIATQHTQDIIALERRKHFPPPVFFFSIGTFRVSHWHIMARGLEAHVVPPFLECQTAKTICKSWVFASIDEKIPYIVVLVNKS